MSKEERARKIISTSEVTRMLRTDLKDHEDLYDRMNRNANDHPDPAVRKKIVRQLAVFKKGLIYIRELL